MRCGGSITSPRLSGRANSETSFDLPVRFGTWHATRVIGLDVCLTLVLCYAMYARLAFGAWPPRGDCSPNVVIISPRALRGLSSLLISDLHQGILSLPSHVARPWKYVSMHVGL